MTPDPSGVLCHRLNNTSRCYVIATNNAGWLTAQIRSPYGFQEGTGAVSCRQSTSRDGAVGRGRKEAVRLAVTATLRESRVIHHPHSYFVTW